MPHRMNLKRNTEIKLTKLNSKKKILRAPREKQQITFKGIPIRPAADLSSETLQARREWQNIFEVMKRRNLEPRLLYPGKLLFRFDGEIETSQTSKI